VLVGAFLGMLLVAGAGLSMPKSGTDLEELGRDETRSYALPRTSRIQAFTNASSFHESYRPLGPP
jgi:hypothetical protein